MSRLDAQNDYSKLLNKEIKLLVIDGVLFATFVLLSILFIFLQQTILTQCCLALSASAIIFLITLMIIHLVKCIKYNKCISQKLQHEQTECSKCPYYIDSNGKVYFGD